MNSETTGNCDLERHWTPSRPPRFQTRSFESHGCSDPEVRWFRVLFLNTITELGSACLHDPNDDDPKVGLLCRGKNLALSVYFYGQMDAKGNIRLLIEQRWRRIINLARQSPSVTPPRSTQPISNRILDRISQERTCEDRISLQFMVERSRKPATELKITRSDRLPFPQPKKPRRNLLSRHRSV